jgi:hypothetical protein
MHDMTAPIGPETAKERPIMFSGPMVRALLAARKTQTRRLATSPLRKCQPGDRLWVRETHATTATGDVEYRADFHEGSWQQSGPWRPSIHMPRRACRLTLRVTEVRFQRLHDISEEDARAEGIRPLPLQSADDPSAWWESDPGENQARTANESYAKLWVSLHGEGSWAANPEIVAITFTTERADA